MAQQRTTHDDLNQLIAWQVEQARNATVMAEQYRLQLTATQAKLAETQKEVERLQGLLNAGKPQESGAEAVPA